MSNEEITKNEVVKQDTEDMTVYHYVDTEEGLNVKSKEVFKKQDKFIIYPFFLHRKSGEARPKYHKIKSFTFEGMTNKLPPGFISSASRGYGVTRSLRPLIKIIESNVDTEDITISKDKKTEITKSSFVLNYKDLETIRKDSGSISRLFYEKNRTLVNNHFAKLIPQKFKNKREKYQKGTISQIINEYEHIEQSLSADDKSTLLELFKKLSLAKNNLFEKQELISTREKIEKKFIEDVLKEFERLLLLKKVREEKWQDFFKENAWIFSQLFAHPTVLFEDKAYVGGKTIQNKDGKVVDFLYANKLTKNSALIEIKKHTTKLLSKKPYRGTDVFHMDKELSGVINQVLDQKETYCKKFDSIRGEANINSFNPKCIIIIGKISSLDGNQSKAFELLRSSLKDIEIVTFDELYDRIKSILSIFRIDENEKQAVQTN